MHALMFAALRLTDEEQDHLFQRVDCLECAKTLMEVVDIRLCPGEGSIRSHEVTDLVGRTNRSLRNRYAKRAASSSRTPSRQLRSTQESSSVETIVDP